MNSQSGDLNRDGSIGAPDLPTLLGKPGPRY